MSELPVGADLDLQGKQRGLLTNHTLTGSEYPQRDRKKPQISGKEIQLEKAE
jgi:hypothetical protein